VPTIVHGNDAFTGVEIRDESAYQTGTGSFIGVPVIRETMHLEYDQVPPSPEFGSIGSQTLVEVLNKRGTGELVFNPRIDGSWFNFLLGHVFGEERRVLNTFLDDTVATGGNSHWYLPNNVGRSMAIRVWKSGPSAAGRWAEFRGCIVTSFRFELPPDGLATVTIAFVAATEVDTDVTGSPAAPTGAITTKARWLTNTGANFQTGATLANRDVRGFTLNVDRHVTADPAFMNSIDTANQPGPTENRTVTCEVLGLLTQDFAASGQPATEYLNRTASKCRIRLRDTVVAAAGQVYAMDLDFPSVSWIAGDDSVKEAGNNPVSHTFQAIEGATATPAHGNMDARIGVFVADTVDLDDHFTVDAGNVVQS